MVLQHFDVFLSHNSGEKPTVERIAEKLKRVGLEPWLDKWYLTPGGDWQTELAVGLRTSSACAVFIGPHWIGDWEDLEHKLATDRMAKDRAFRVFLVLLPGLPEPFDASTLPPFLSLRTWVDLRRGIEDVYAFQGLINAIKGMPLGPERQVEQRNDVCPYRGLQSFAEEHAEFFFGRDGDIQRLIEKLKERRFLAVIGPSGSGKSSLVRAGLISALRKGRLADSDTWKIQVFTPGAHPLTTLAANLLRLYQQNVMHKTLDQMSGDQRTLHLAVSLALAERPASERVVLIVDQFEEVFTLCRDERERTQFFANLLYAALIPGGRSAVILTMRADFYPKCATYPELSERIAAQQYLVSQMNTDSLRQAIEEPAWHVGLEFEPGLVATILEDVANQPGVLPLLEHALLELWERRRGQMLTLEAYLESGMVGGAIAKRADAIYASFSKRQQEIIRRIMLRLTQPGDGTEDTRRRAAISEFATGLGDRAAVEDAVQALTDARLLTTSVDEKNGERLVDVSHEALIRSWLKLRQWIDEDREGLRFHRRLTEAAQEWRRLNRDEGILFRGARLTQAVDWGHYDRAALNELEQEFISASVGLQDKERLAVQRRVRLALGGLTTALVFISVIAFIAFNQRNSAEQALAIVNRQDRSVPYFHAIMRGHTANVNSAVFSPNGQLIVTVSDDNTGRVWEANSGRSNAELRGHTGQVLGAAFSPNGALVVTASQDGTARVWRASSGRIVAELRGSFIASSMGSAAFSPDGKLVVTAGNIRDDFEYHYPELEPLPRTIRSGYSAWVWEVPNWNWRPIELAGHRGNVRSPAFSPDGKLLVTASGDGTARVWEVGNWKRIELSGHTGIVRSAAFSPDGKFVITAGGKKHVMSIPDPGKDLEIEDQTARVWEASSGRILAELRGHTDDVNSAAFSPDGKLAVTASKDHTARVWEVATGKSTIELRGHTTNVSSAMFSPNGRLILTVSGDTALVWEASSGKIVAELRGHTGMVRTAAFSPDGKLVVTASDDHTARVWEVNDNH